MYTGDDLAKFIHRLYEIGAVKFDIAKGFTLRAHQKNPTLPLSPIFLNLRTPENPKPGPLGQKELDDVARFFYYSLHASNVQYEGLCGVPRAGEPFANGLQNYVYQADHVSPPCILLNKEETGKGHRQIGKVSRNRGLQAGSRVLLVDDLITKADSKIEAVKELRDAGYVVEHCLVLVDREQGGRQELKGHGVELHFIFTLNSMLLLYKDGGVIDQPTYDTVTKYLSENS